MSVYGIIGVVVASIVLIVLASWLLVGIVTYSLSIKRNGLIGRGMTKRFAKKVASYGVDLSWWNDKELEKLIIENDELKLCAYLLRTQNFSRKVVIMGHGYFRNHREMQPYAKFFLEMGYNVFMPDARAHGSSEGKTVGMGWTDRKDYLKWIELVIEIFGNETQIVLFGISMGASTVCMVAGEELPKNVKCVISDCAYDSAFNEFSYLLGLRFVPFSFLIKNIANKFSKWIGGYSLREASTIKQVAKSPLPIFFIHGSKDMFSPVYMSHNLYHSHNPELREIYIAEGARHSRSYILDKDMYEDRVRIWLKRWVD